MTHKINSFEGLNAILLEEDDQIDDLAQAFRSRCEIQRKEAALRTIEFQTDNILKQSRGALISNYSENVDDARYLAAYLLAFKEQSLDNKKKKYTTVFFSLVDLLKQIVPSFNTELETMSRIERDRCSVSNIYFSWKNIISPFSVETLAGSLLKTKITFQTGNNNDQTKEDEMNEKAEIEPATCLISEPNSSQKADSEVATVDKQEKKQDAISKSKVKQNKCPSYEFGEENKYTEFKPTFFEGSCNNNPQPFNVCREICAFLNAEGGTIYIGVGDDGKALPKKRNGRLYGVEYDIQIHRLLPESRDVYCRVVKSKIRAILERENKTKIDKFINDLDVIPFKWHDNVVEIVVPKSNSIIYLEGVAYQRSGSECKKMTQEQINERRKELSSKATIKEYQRTLKKAIHDKKQVILHNYRSRNSDTVTDRCVEPIEFASDYTSIQCYDNEKNGMRTFVLSRIGDGGVEILESDWINESQHMHAKSDLFGWRERSGKYHISLDMKLSAHDYLLSTFQQIKQKHFIQLSDEVWRLDTCVYSLCPVVLFFIGNADAVTINNTEDSEKLKDEIFRYVNDKVLAKLRSCTDLIPADLTVA